MFSLVESIVDLSWNLSLSGRVGAYHSLFVSDDCWKCEAAGNNGSDNDNDNDNVSKHPANAVPRLPHHTSCPAAVSAWQSRFKKN